MNRRFISVLIFALLVSAVASVILYRLIAAKLTANAGSPTTKIVVAAHNLNVGAVVTPADLTLADWSGDPPQGAFRTTDDVLTRGVIAGIYAGEAVLDSRLAQKGAGGGLAATIPQGMRAVAVRVNEVVGVSGFVLPGMHVDIIIAGNPPRGEGAGNVGTITKTILQNIEVLSAGPNIQRDNEGKPVSVAVVNLLVTPEDAEILSLASSEMKIQLVLRNPMDKDVTKTSGTDVANLFAGTRGLPGGAPAPAPAPVRRAKKVEQDTPAPPPPPVQVVVAPPPPPPAAPPPITVEIYNGTKKTETKFPGQETKP
jgi:pilus assembly protein CpaB